MEQQNSHNEDQDQNVRSMHPEIPSYMARKRRIEKRLNVFHLRCLRKILGIIWQDKVTNNEILVREKSSTYDCNYLQEETKT